MGTKTRNLASGLSDDNALNIGLLGFKMAVNEGLTVFNLVDGVVDEFNDESGTDEAEGSNDYYCGTSDIYSNRDDSVCISAGFTMTTVTEPDTSTAGTNPVQESGTMGVFTVPSGVTSVNMFAWGAAGGTDGRTKSPSGDLNMTLGGGGGFASGTLAVTPGQSLYILAGEGGEAGGPGAVCTPGCYARGGFFGGGKSNNPVRQSGGGGNTGVFAASATSTPQISAPQVYLIAGSGGGGGNDAYLNVNTGLNAGSGSAFAGGGGGGGCTAQTGTAADGGQGVSQTNSFEDAAGGGAGSQTQGGQGGSNPSSSVDGQSGSFLTGGNVPNPGCSGFQGAGGAGYYGGGAGARGSISSPSEDGSGGGGSGYTSHPQITCGSKIRATTNSGAGRAQPNYVACTSESGAFVYGSNPFPYTVTAADYGDGEDGYVLLSGSTDAFAAPGGGSTTIVSQPFTSTSVSTNARIVVFEENVDTPTLNTDIIASVSRDGGTTFTNATLSDSGYVTGSSGQRILTGQADISGQPTGQSMRWKLALANNTVKIHGVSLQWS